MAVKTHDLSSCEIKARKNFRPERDSLAFSIIYGYITHCRCDKPPVDLIAHPVKHCTGIDIRILGIGLEIA